jgi:O-methyltransferase
MPEKIMPSPAASLFLREFKQTLTWIGRWIPQGVLSQMESAVNYLKVGRWMAEHGFNFTNRVPNRLAVWEVITRQIGDQPVLYLEFGVAAGGGIRYWCANLRHPETVLHGFDSFEGMPASGGPWVKGQFSTHGQIPEIHDPRVRFFKGWFEQILPNYTAPFHSILILNLDADLYSSTSYVLRQLQPYIRKGAFIYFDEMNIPEHELKAFDEFIHATGLKFAPVAADNTLTHVCFRCLG